MSLTLRVDAARWRAHLDRTIRANPGIVPVIKGNGYGFGLDLLLAEATRLHGSAGVSQIAVGTYAEARIALAAYPGDVLVLEPYQAILHADLAHLGDHALVHNVVTEEDATDLGRRTRGRGRPRVLVEGLASMNRFGAPFDKAGALLAHCSSEDVSSQDSSSEDGSSEVSSSDDGRATATDVQPGAAVDLVGATLHLPLGDGHLAEVTRWVDTFEASRWYLSHTTPGELASLKTAHPTIDFHPRIGTALWLGDLGALSVRAHVLAARAVAAGDHAGYRQRTLRVGTLVVVSGGTAHGVALEAPSAATTMRQRAIAVAEGVLEAAGRVRSPFTIAGHPAWFVEPPHMQVSLLILPEGVTPPAVGDEVEVRVRHTTLHADDVVFG